MPDVTAQGRARDLRSLVRCFFLPCQQGVRKLTFLAVLVFWLHVVELLKVIKFVLENFGGEMEKRKKVNVSTGSHL